MDKTNCYRDRSRDTSRAVFWCGDLNYSAIRVLCVLLLRELVSFYAILMKYKQVLCLFKLKINKIILAKYL